MRTGSFSPFSLLAAQFPVIMSNERTGEINFYGRAVSRGVAIGKVVCLIGQKRQFFRLAIDDGRVKEELLRLKRAFVQAEKQLVRLATKTESSADNTKANIFDAHRLILADDALAAKIEFQIARQKINAEWAIKIVADELISDYKRIGDEHLRERYIDLKDVAERLLNALGEEKPNVPIEKDAVVVAREIKPSTLIELAEISPRAVVTEAGGWTSHTFILAREMNLPAVAGIEGVLRRVETGDEIIVDGYAGKIILRPSRSTLREYETAAESLLTAGGANFAPLDAPVKMLDGREISICANADLPEVYLRAKRFGARGVGLYRSEFLFNLSKRFPTEAEQLDAYRKIADAAGDAGVSIRTFDLSAENFAGAETEKESNPALGLRAIRLGLARSEEFRAQIRAVLQASAKKKIDIVLPMISDVSEIFAAKRILDEEKESLRARKIEAGSPRVGAMIEVPSAVLMIEEIAAAVDFLSLGTNDLVQYLLAVDRDNPAVAEWFRTIHPAVIRALKKIFTAAENREKPVVVCGEMAGSPFYAPVLVGLGATRLSMNVNSILRVGRVLKGVAFEEARELAQKLERCASADESENAARAFFAKKWSHLYTPDILPLAPASPK